MCSPNANCLNTLGSHECTCNSGYIGNGIICLNVNECSAGTHDCDFNANCKDVDGSFYCRCNSGYKGSVLHIHKIDLKNDFNL
jgi:hypothetical protein